ncbi:hypothetical protein CCACVL1_14628 [Corchorus capsularis]|uniref:Uncharacterized protein n=1 Tax=Corchorus capsularis TaxID=210143 RepID=A0A1R3I6D0_COCAP|nr:hypothetical protein CCACVL1_14628 [Corchorus capsularis]
MAPVSVEMVPGGPHFTILPPMACAMSEDREVKLVEPCLKVSKVNLTSWSIGGGQAFIFNNQWHKIVVDNSDTLKPMAVFQIWSFWVRRESQKPELGFAPIKVGDVPD